jgi:hypothetical protein
VGLSYIILIHGELIPLALGTTLLALRRQMSQISLTPIFVAAMLGLSLRSVERLIEAGELPAPSQRYPREWTGPALTALADRLSRRPSPAARAASAVIERLAAGKAPLRSERRVEDEQAA